MEKNTANKRKGDFFLEAGKLSVWSFPPVSRAFNLLGNCRGLPFWYLDSVQYILVNLIAQCVSKKDVLQHILVPLQK